MKNTVLVLAMLAGWSGFEVRSFAQSPSNPAPDTTSQWPMVIDEQSRHVTIFQPQMETFEGDTLTARAAVSIATDGIDQPTFGAVWLKSRVATDRVARTVEILDVQITKTRFPNSDATANGIIATEIQHAITAQPITLSLDHLLASLETVQQQTAASEDFKNDPPKIIFRDHPAVKVQFDGGPKFVETDHAPLLRAVNTPFFIALDPQSKTYFLKGAGQWFSANDPRGPFQAAANVPADVSTFADASDYKDPQDPLPAGKAAGIEIITATEPTELIWTDGQAQWTPISGTGLLYLANTEGDVFMDISSQKQFVVLSGRWYSSPNRDGPWAYVDPQTLPGDFKNIPPNSDKGDVLAQIPGTQAAEDAVADAQIPQTAAIDRNKIEQPTVQYDGDPQFEPIEGVAASYATNTDVPIVEVRDHFYCCHEAAWYDSISPNGPWGICTNVPVEIYRIPPSCPIYPVRYVYVYGHTDDVVYVGYTPGYVGCYPFRNAVVFGTGYRYAPWSRRVYFSRPATFGFAAHYNSYVGHWGFGFGLASGGGGAWLGQGPRAWGRSQPWLGYGGYRPLIVHQDVRVNLFQQSYVERVRGERVVDTHPDRFDRNVYERRADFRRDDNRPRDVKVSPRADSDRDNVFADHDGNIFRRSGDGWETRDHDQWKRDDDTPHDSPRVIRNGSDDKPVAAPNHADDKRDANDAHDQRDAHDSNPSRNDHDDRVATHGPVAAPAAPADPSRGRSERGVPDNNNRDIDRDLHARQSGSDRLRGYESPTPKPAAPANHDDNDHTGPRGGRATEAPPSDHSDQRGHGVADPNANSNSNSRNNR